MKWTETKSDKNYNNKLVIIYPYANANDGELHDKNISWLKKEVKNSFSLL